MAQGEGAIVSLIAICFDRPVQDQLTILLGTRTLFGVMEILRRHPGCRQRSKNNQV
jgi:predicted ATP-dependent Lon-type protease